MDKLKFIAEQMDILGIPYELNEWTSNVTYPYFVGEFTEEPTATEDGSETTTGFLTGFMRGSFIDLERAKEKIKAHFSPIHGLRAKTGSGSIAVFFDGSFPVPTGEAGLKRIQINLTIKEWRY